MKQITKPAYIIPIHIISMVMMLTLILGTLPISVTAIFGDADNDGVPEIVLNNGRNTDNCPALFNPDQRDIDLDGLGDACDPQPDVPNPPAEPGQPGQPEQPEQPPEQQDNDNDGIPNEQDNCPNEPNNNRQDRQRDTDNDGNGDACDPDDDNDGVPDGQDNCSLAANPAQENHDRDAQGNECDNDDDDDGLPDERDACPLGNGPRSAPECQDEGIPNLRIIAPENNDVLRTSTVEFRFAVSDDRDVRLDCEILSDIRGGGIETIHRLTGTHAILDMFTGFRMNRHRVENVPDGAYRWFAACTDDNRNRGISEIAEFTVLTRDNVAPTVLLFTPRDNEVVNRDDVTFSFSVQDNTAGPVSCQLLTDISGNFEATGNARRMNQGLNNFLVSDIPDGTYKWGVECSDAAGNRGQSPGRFTFIVDVPELPIGQCANGVQDADAGEEGVDCGGPCADACPAIQPQPEPPVIFAQTSQPQVTLTATADTGVAPFRVVLTAHVMNGDAQFRYVWEFDDGTSVETYTNTVEHIYTGSGSRRASVRVFDADGDSAWASLRFRVHSGVRDGERDLRLGTVSFEGWSEGYGVARAGEQMMVSASFTNTGAATLQNLKMSISSFDLDLHHQALIHRLAAGETSTPRLIVEIPADTPPGEYLIRLAVTDENQLTKVTYHPLLVVENALLA